MKFLYIFVFFFLYNTSLEAQQKKEKSPTGGDCEPYQYGDGPPGSVGRVGDPPYEEVMMRRELNTLLNARNWEVNTNTSTSATFSTFTSPFYSPENINVRHLNLGSNNPNVPFIDYYKQGWRLIKKSIGTNTQPMPNPHFVFYNVYTAKYRVFLLLTQIYSNLTNPDPQSANNATLVFKLKNTAGNYTPNFFGEISNPSPTVIEKDIIKEISFPQKVISLAPWWVFGEFSVSYDPCACRDNRIEVQPLVDISLLIDTGSNVSLCSYNDPQQQCSEILNPSGAVNNQKKNMGMGSEIASVAGSVDKFVKEAYNSSKDVKTGFSDFTDGYTKAFAPPKFNGQAFDLDNPNPIGSIVPFAFSNDFIKYGKKYNKHKSNVNGLKKILAGVGKAVEILGTISSGVSTIYSIIKMFTGSEEEGGAKAFIPYLTQGTIKGRSENSVGTFALSGTKQYNEKTVYPNLGGILTVLEPPKVKYSRVQPQNPIWVYPTNTISCNYWQWWAPCIYDYGYGYQSSDWVVNSPQYWTTINQRRDSQLWGHNYFLFDEIPKVVVNPALNVDLENSEISVSYEFEDIDNIPNRFDKDLTDYNQIQYNNNNLLGVGELYAKNMVSHAYVGNHTISKILDRSMDNFFGMTFIPYQYENFSIPTPMYQTPYYPLGCMYENRYQNAVYFRTMPSLTQDNLPKVYIKVVAKLQPRNTLGQPMDKILYVNRYKVNLIEDKSLEQNDWLKYYKYRTDQMSLDFENVHVDYEGWNTSYVAAKQTIDVSVHGAFSAALANKRFLAGMSVEVLPYGNPELQSDVDIQIIPGWNEFNNQTNCSIPILAPNSLITCSQGLYNTAHYFVKPADVEQAAEMGEKSKIHENILTLYPNPASQFVTFGFEIEDATQSKIYVTDIMGNKITDYTQFTAKEKGKYEVIANVSTWASGIYLVILETKNEKVVKKLVVTK